MEFLPVGKRTRLQKAKMLKDQNKRARLAAKREWRKRVDKDLVVVKEEVEEDVVVIDKDEFFKEIDESVKKNSQIEQLGIVKNEVFDYDDVNYGKNEVPLLLDDKGKGIMNDDGSDDSVQFLGVRWNPLGLCGGIDDDDDDDDNGNDDGVNGCHPLALQVSSGSEDEWKEFDGKDEGEKDEGVKGKNVVLSEKSSDFEASSSEEEDDSEVSNRKFLWQEHISSESSEVSSSSSDGYVEEVDDRMLHSDDGKRELHSNDVILIDDDGDVDDQIAHDLDDKVDYEVNGVYVDDEVVVGDKIADEVDDDEHDDDDDVRYRKRKKFCYGENEKRKKLCDGENAKRVKIDEKRKQESGEKRKRGRPPKKTKVVESQSPSSSKRVKKSRQNEIQNILLNTILDVGNQGLDEVLTCTTEFYLSLKFKFGVNKLMFHEKTEDEQELDCLFKELDFALQACNIGAGDSPMYDKIGDSEKVVPSDGASSQVDLCAKGKHHLIHDDEIGVICKFCLYVNLEIKHVMPDFNKDPFGRGDRRDYGRFLYEDNIACGGFQFPESSYDHRGDCSPSDDIQGTVWDLIPGIKRTLYPHQRDGFEFIWRNLAGGIKIDELGKPTKFGLGGCIICHAPGTGKTRLAIVFLQSFMRQYRKAKPVIVAPFSMLRTWEEEFARWKVDIPFFNLNDNELSGREDLKVLGYFGNMSKKTIRLVKLHTWASGEGVLAISYGLLSRLAGEKDGTDEKVREVLLKQPGLLLLDEGHTARNDKSYIWKALSNISTKRRVILSGTPFQNNFDELHNTISLVREDIGAPVLSGHDVQKYKRIAELRKRIKPFVHVHRGEILRETLRGLFHSLLILKPSTLQKVCFEQLAGIKNRFEYENLVSVTSVHPSILCERKSAFFDEAFESLLQKHRMDLDAGVKTRFLLELIKLSKGERVLVFGQYISPLNFIADLLKQVFCWSMGNELLYMDGQLDVKERQSSIRLFNDPKSEARVLLASTKACCEGIHLVGASRVVLLDVVWNPSVERQAISRAYRLGQKKDVFVYHLIASGTLEEEKYQRQATKERLSELVFSSDVNTEKKSARSRVSEDRVLEEMILHEKMKNMFEKIVYQPKADNLVESFNMDL